MVPALDRERRGARQRRAELERLVELGVVRVRLEGRTAGDRCAAELDDEVRVVAPVVVVRREVVA